MTRVHHPQTAHHAPAKPEPKTMLVRATARGHDNVRIREIDEVFEMPQGATAPWFEPVKD